MADETDAGAPADPALRLDWSVGDETPVHPANLGLVQIVGPEVTLTFGHAVPTIPMAFLNRDQLAEYAREHAIPVRNPVRLVLPAHVAWQFSENLRQQLILAGLGGTEPEAGS